MTEIIRGQSLFEDLAAEYICPVSNWQDIILAQRGVERPILYVFFRPEEIHAASIEGSRPFPPLGKGCYHLPNCIGWVYFQDLILIYSNTNQFTTIQAATFDKNF